MLFCISSQSLVTIAIAIRIIIIKIKSALIIIQMSLRYIIGSVVTSWMISDFFKIAQLKFQYPYIASAKRNSQQLPQIIYYPGTWFLIIRDRFNLFTSFKQSQKDELVLVEDFDGSLNFKVVAAASRTYSQFQNGASYYVPTGFSFLVDPHTKTIGLEPLGSVKQYKYFSLGKWTTVQQPKNEQFKKTEQDKQYQKSIESQILQKNNFMGQIQQFKITKSNNIEKNNQRRQQFHDFAEDYGFQK